MKSDLPLLLNAEGSRALVMGSGTFTDGSRLTEIPSVATTVEDVAATLTESCGLDPAHLTTLADPADPAHVLAGLSEAMREASRAFLFYYVGHGLQDDRGQELHLATYATKRPAEAVPLLETLPYGVVGEMLARCEAEHVIVVLDCCFSGMAAPPRGNGTRGGFDNVRTPGSYLLASSSHLTSSFAPSGSRHTAFSGELIRLLTEGDPTGPPLLTLDYLYRSLTRSLPAKGFPLPYRQVTDLGDRSPLARNPAYQPDVPADLPRAVTEDDQESPYRGLAAFGPGDEAMFFGRDETTARLVERTLSDRLIAVVGASGSGKSSLLRAGLAPELERRGHRCMIMVPGADPLAELSTQLADQGLPDQAVIIVDQFEELFTASGDEAVHAAFVQSLIELPATVVLSVRSDFFGACLALPALEPAMSRPMLVPALTTAQLREAIEKPARLSGLTLENGLVELLLEDLAGSANAGGLPLLSHALLESWRHRSGRTLTLAAYRAIGGVRRSLANTAETTFGALTESDREIAHRMMLRLVHVGEVADTRRRVRLADLSAEIGTAIVESFVRARLITADEHTAEIAHEALLDAWPRLKSWIVNDRARLLAVQRLDEDAETWRSQQHDAAYLYAGSRLASAEAAIPADRHVELTPLAREFLQQSSGRAVHRRRLLRTAAATLAVLLVLALAAGTIALRLADQNGHERDLAISGQILGAAEDMQDFNLRTQLGLAAFEIADTPETRGAVIGAAHINPGMRVTGHGGSVSIVAFTPDGRIFATGALDGQVRLWDVRDPARPRLLSTMASPRGPVESVAFSSDGKLMAVGAPVRQVDLWDVSDPARPKRKSSIDPVSSKEPIEKSPADFVAYRVRLAFSPHRPTLVVSFLRYTGEAAVSLWNVGDPAHPVGRELLSNDENVAGSPAISAESILALGNRDGTTTLYDVGDIAKPRLVGTVRGHTDAVNAADFDASGHTLITASGDKSAHIWDVTSPSEPISLARMPLNDSGVDVAVHGHFVATGSGNREVSVWDISAPREPQIMAYALQYTEKGDLAFSPDGRFLATGSRDAVARLWAIGDIQAITGYGQWYSFGGVVDTAIGRDGRIVASAATDGTVALTDLSDPLHPIPLGLLRGHSGDVTGVAIHPDGQLLAIASSDGTSQLWDIRDPSRPVAMTSIDLTSFDDFGISSDITGVSFSSDGRLFSLSHGFMMEIWEVTDPERPIQKSLKSPHLQNIFGGLAFNPTGPLLATASNDFTAKLWDVSDPSQPQDLATLSGHSGALTHLAFSRDGRTLVTGAADGTVRVWDVSTPSRPRTVAVLQGPAGDLYAAALNRNGSRVAVSSQDGTVRVWDLHPSSPPELAFLLRDWSGPAQTVTFTPDDRHLVMGSVSGSLIVRRLDLAWALRRICEVAGAPLSPQEWAAYIPDREYAPPCR
ncbi:hypothetical protein GCM10009555_107410 [Acrocarpospora macrocephala]|uniref:Novel STAND NTPase 1 domain-containing protein n=1 Tax=Acrocarpospora macrocephala TaxID=150177 RepID=A0A5M3X787_9ACTN|nr:caspase family protein [Acrocarpospora macrocephala]GES16964.1 hypothetical protein Amac_105620 [Acrocarpospora macrocephala]